MGGGTSSSGINYSRTSEYDDAGGGKRRHLNPGDSEYDDSGGGKRRHLNPRDDNRDAVQRKPTQYSQNNNNNQGGGFLFDHNNQNPSQAQVDEFFRNKPELNPKEITNIFLRAVQWKKKKRIDVLGGDKLSFLTGRLQCIVSELGGRQLTQTAMATINGLQAIAPTNVQTSGKWW